MEKPLPPLHIITVGTSILTNFKRPEGGRWTRGMPLQPNPTPAVPPPSPKVSRWTRGMPLPDDDALFQKVCDDPTAASAELHALLKAVENTGEEAAKNPADKYAIHLLISDSEDGKCCGRILKQYFAEDQVHCTEDCMEGLTPETPDDDGGAFYSAVRQLRSAIFKVTDRAKKRNQPVQINAAGGLKSMSGTAALIAAELHIPVYMIFESSPSVIYLPTTPLDAKAIRLIRDIRYADARKKREIVSERMPELVRLEKERLVKLTHGPDGEPASCRLTDYGKYLARERP